MSRKRIEEPTSQKFWNNYMLQYSVTINWKEQYELIRVSTQDSSLRMLQYKILHNIINTRAKLKLQKIQDNDICNLCKTERQTLPHLLFNCQYITRLIKLILTDNNLLINPKQPADARHSLLLLTYQNSKQYKCLNKLLMWTKQFTIRQINTETQLPYKMFTQFIATNVKYEYAIANRNGNLQQTKEKWKEITLPK